MYTKRNIKTYAMSIVLANSFTIKALYYNVIETFVNDTVYFVVNILNKLFGEWVYSALLHFKLRRKNGSGFI